MSTFASTYSIDYVASANLTNGTATLASGAVSGIIQLGKNRLYMISCKDTTTPASISQIAITLGNKNGTTAPAPVSTSPFLSVTQSLVFDTGDGAYDQLQLGNFHNGTDSIDYSVLLLSRF